MRTQLENLKKELRDKGVEVENLAFLSCEGDQVIGEVSPDAVLVGRAVDVTNPMRFMRLQRAGPEGVQIEFILGSFDMVDEGTIQMSPTLGFFVRNLSTETQLNYCGLLLNFFQQRSRQRAHDAGIVIPSIQPGFRPPNGPRPTR